MTEPLAYDDGGISSVGDVNSTAIGSGARYNGGKVPLELIPFRILSITSKDVDVKYCFVLLDKYQFSGETRYLSALLNQLSSHMDEAAWVFDYGKRKYAEWNWLKGMAWSIPLACIGRHLQKIDSGELTDIESGRSHWGHIICNLIMLITYAEVYPQGNDLPKKPERIADDPK